MNEPTFLTPREVSEIFRVSVMTVHRMIARGEIEARRVGRQYRIPAESVRRVLEGIAEAGKAGAEAGRALRDEIRGGSNRG